MSLKRKMQRQIQKNNGTLTHKKVIAKKLGCSLAECNRRLERREKNLRKLEGKENGTE
nr:hypothetical protein [uncultured Clostridium sp.]